MLHKQHATDHEAASAAARLVVIPRGVRGQAQWHTFPWLQFHSRQKKEQINIAHRSTLLEAHTWAGGSTRPSNEDRWIPALTRCTEGNMNQKTQRCQTAPLLIYILHIFWFNLWLSNEWSLWSDQGRAATRAHPGWFPCFSIASSFSISGPAEAHHTAFYTLQRGKGYPLLNATEYRLPLL